MNYKANYLAGHDRREMIIVEESGRPNVPRTFLYPTIGLSRVHLVLPFNERHLFQHRFRLLSVSSCVGIVGSNAPN